MTGAVHETSGLEAALAEAEAAGGLPITSTCNTACLFCSNQGNPPGLRVYRLPPRPLAAIESALRALARREAIVIGESASRVSEGEPLTHPDFAAIVRLARRLAPRALLKLTTNGTLLTPRLASLLAASGPAEVTLSLNTASPAAYARLCGRALDPRPAPRLLARAGVPFRASLVCVPAVTGPEDLRHTVRYLEDHGCLDVRVLVPAFTDLTPAGVRSLLPSREEVATLVAAVRAETGLPLSLEPPAPGDLQVRLTGVTRDSPAARAGLKAGDVLSRVEGKTPFSRVDAFERCQEVLRRAGGCRVEVSGRGEVVLQAAGAPSAPRPGFVLDRDLDPADAVAIRRLAAGVGAGRAFVLTSTLAATVLRLGLEASWAATPAGTGRSRRAPGWPGFEVFPVPSRVFGGSIASAGLLTLRDFETALAALVAAGRGPRTGDAVFLPPAAFDSGGLDLLGRDPSDLRSRLAPGVRLVVPGVAVL